MKVSKHLVWVSLIVYAACMYISTHAPIPPQAKSFVNQWDKLLHGGAFFVLGVLASLALLNRTTWRLPIWPILIGLPLYAAFDEYTQGFVGRTPDIQDWYWDVGGAFLGVFVVAMFARWQRRTTTVLYPELLASGESDAPSPSGSRRG